MAESASKSLLDPELLARLMAQPLVTRFPMEGSITGQHKSPHRGSSVEFAEYRNYVPGDDIRRLDWRVFGRTDRFYLKEFEAETNLRCYVVVDCSASMGFEGRGPAKLSLAKKIAAAIAYLTIHQGDAVGLICVGPKVVQEVPPRRNPAHMQTILEVLNGLTPSGTTGLMPCLHELAERVRRRALVIVVSDFFCELNPLLECFQHLRFQKHDLAVFQLLDPMEVDFNFDRPVRFVDLESTLALVTEPSTIRDEYLRQFNAFRERLRTGCNEFKAEYRSLLTDQSLEKFLGDFLMDRARGAAPGARA